MNDAGNSRVVIWLDPTAPQAGALQVLAGLGRANEILGLFIEDMSLLELSRLRVAREITADASASGTLDPGNIERQFRAHARRMQKQFESTARRIGASHRFQIARGEPGTELLRISTGCDMLIVAHSRRDLAARLTMRARLDELLEHGPPALLLVQEQWCTGHCIASLFDDGAASEAALHTAAALSRAEELDLRVWLTEAAPAIHEQRMQRVREILRDGVRYSCETLPSRETDELARATKAQHVRALVLPGEKVATTRRLVAELLERVNCSLIVAR